MRVLLLEDDEIFGATLEDFLDEIDFETVWCKDGQDALEISYETKFDIFLLDINVPKINGLDFLRQIRQNHCNAPAIFLTSFKDQETIKNAFGLGCDDYLKKPFELDELELRIRAVLSRCGLGQNFYHFRNGCIFDFVTKRLTCEGKEINLGTKILDLLELLLKNKNKIVSKEHIAQTIWTFGEEISDGSLRVYVNKLRKILDIQIINAKNLGYQFLENE